MLTNETLTPSKISTCLTTDLDVNNPQVMVDAYAEANVTGNAPLARDIAWLAVIRGQELNAMMARCDEQRGRCHESDIEDIWKEHDRHVNDLRILKAVPALKAAIEEVSPDDIATIRDQYGPWGDL